MTVTVKRRAPFDAAHPPEGQRLMLATIATQLRVSMRELTEVTELGHGTVFRLLCNQWPARCNARERDGIRARIEALMRERGASDEQIALLWHARSNANQAQLRRCDAQAAGPAFPPDQPPEEPDMLLPKQTLSPAARRHFKLFANPFDGDVRNDEQMWNGADVRYVREAAWQCAQNGGFVAVVGESGAGKTTVQADLEARLEREARGVIVIRPGVLGMEESNNKGQVLKSTDILHAIITTLQPGATVPQTLQARTVRAAKMLGASLDAGATHLLVIEEAHALPDATLKHLKRLHELRAGRRNLLGILLIAQPELKLRLANGLRTGTLREVAQRCELVELLPIDGELQGYLQVRAAAAGAELSALLDDGAAEALRTRLTRKTAAGAVSMCYPLAVNNMLTRALNQAADLGVPKVTRDVVMAC